MFTILEIEQDLIGMGHGGTLNKIRNPYALYERAAAIFLLQCHPINSMRTTPLASAVYDDQYNYQLPSDFGSIIDLIPQSERKSWDESFRVNAGQFDLEKAIKNRTISIEGQEGTKIIRINWKSHKPTVLNEVNSTTSNGTWMPVGAATFVTTDNITYYSGNGSVRFDVNNSGDGIQNTTMQPVNLSVQSQIATEFFAVYFGSDYENLESIGSVWGNNLTSKYWTGVPATAQYDGTAFQNGWNIIGIPWPTAAQTGTVDSTAINSAKIIFNTNGSPMLNVRLDNITFNIGKDFDIKYYSKYLFKSAATDLWISQPASENDYVMIDNDTLPLFLYECLQEMAQQMEGTNAAFDIGQAQRRLMTLYPAYRGMYPSLLKKSTAKYGQLPFRRRW